MSNREIDRKKEKVTCNLPTEDKFSLSSSFHCNLIGFSSLQGVNSEAI